MKPFLPVVVHIINGLEVGGAECLLRQLVLHLRDRRFRHEVISLGDIGPIGCDLREKGIPVLALGLPSIGQALSNVGAAIRMIHGAVVVHTWLYHANLLGGLVGRILAPVVWSLHATHLDPGQTKATTRMIFRLTRGVSWVSPKAIVACGESCYDIHVAEGYDKRRMICIRNGIPTDTFQHDGAAREALRREWKVNDDTVVVGTVSRYDPQKDIGNFVASAAEALKLRSNLRFILCGSRLSEDNAELMDILDRFGVRDHVILLGRRDDVVSVLSAFDLFVLSSASEALPLALCEAMSCGLPAAVTDVGDNAAVVGDTGIVAPAQSPRELGAAIAELAREDGQARFERGKRARRRVVDGYDFSTMADEYEALYRRIADENQRSGERVSPR